MNVHSCARKANIPVSHDTKTETDVDEREKTETRKYKIRKRKPVKTFRLSSVLSIVTETPRFRLNWMWRWYRVYRTPKPATNFWYLYKSKENGLPFRELGLLFQWLIMNYCSISRRRWENEFFVSSVVYATNGSITDSKPLSMRRTGEQTISTLPNLELCQRGQRRRIAGRGILIEEAHCGGGGLSRCPSNHWKYFCCTTCTQSVFVFSSWGVVADQPVSITWLTPRE